jgi:hypothetical protein
VPESRARLSPLASISGDDRIRSSAHRLVTTASATFRWRATNLRTRPAGSWWGSGRSDTAYAGGAFCSRALSPALGDWRDSGAPEGGGRRDWVCPIPAAGLTAPTPDRVAAYLCSRALSSFHGVRGCREVAGFCGHLVVIERQWRCSVTPGAARRAEREALDRRRAGAMWRGVRAGAHAYLGPRPLVDGGAGDMMVMGCRSRWGEVRCGRSVFAGRPRGRGGSSLRGAGRGASAEVGRCARWQAHAGWSV